MLANIISFLELSFSRPKSFFFVFHFQFSTLQQGMTSVQVEDDDGVSEIDEEQNLKEFFVQVGWSEL